MTTIHDHQPSTTAEPVDVSPELLPRLVTVPDAARLLGIGRTTAYELIAAGQLEVVHIGRSTRVPTTAVDSFVNRLRSKPTS
jgi:excisionase family DNA binding protein